MRLTGTDITLSQQKESYQKVVNPPKDPILAAILSVLFAGLGHFYCQKWGRGALFLVGSIVTFALIPPLVIVVWIWCVVDAYRIARSLQGDGSGGEGRVIDIGKPRLPGIDMRQALTYIGIPVGIVALLAIIVILILIRYGLWGERSTSPQLVPLMARIEAYKAQTGSYPFSLSVLIDPTDPIEKKQTLDPWGNPYIYRITTGGFELLSSGKDTIAGTEDDIRYHP